MPFQTLLSSLVAGHITCGSAVGLGGEQHCDGGAVTIDDHWLCKPYANRRAERQRAKLQAACEFCFWVWSLL